MAKYNLINNGIVYTLTGAGTGNKVLTNSQLATLIDGTTTSGGVILTSTDVLYLEADLSARIKTDEIRLYADDLTALNDIDFYYKNTTEDSYTVCSKGVTTDYYYATIPGLSAPRYVLTTISGMDATLHEYIVYNDDYIIGFGDDGSASAVYLDSAPVGEDSAAYPVTIFNNSTIQYPADAYVIIDYTGNASDYYVKISETENGPYYDITDGFILTDDNTSSKYRWSQGTLSNIEIVNNDYIQIDSIVGTPGKLGDIPAVFVGTSGTPWLYDNTANVIYSIHYDGTLKLYKYDLNTYSWTYISWLPTYSLGFNVNLVTMAKAANYIYLTFSANYSNVNWFGRYDLTGAQGNFTWLASSPVVMVLQAGGVSMVYGENGFIYFGVGGAYSVSYLLSYSIASNTWTQLAAPLPYFSASGNIRATLLLDSTRNCLYFLTGRGTIGQYVQRYDIAINFWNTTWFDHYNRLGTIFNYLNMTYYNNKLYFAENSYGNIIYTYDITTDTVDHISTGYTMATTEDPNIIAIPPQRPLDPEVTLFLSNISGDILGLYGYNVDSSMSILEDNIGYYTTPIFDVENKDNSSYFIVDETTVEGMSFVSKDESVANGTIEVRSSDIAPKPIIKIYWPHNIDGYYSTRFNEYDIVANTVSTFTITTTTPSVTSKALAVNPIKGNKYLSIDRNLTVTYDNLLALVSINNVTLYTTSDGFADYTNSHFSKLVEFTYDDKLWGYTGGNYLAHLSINYSPYSLNILLHTAVANIISLSAEYDGTGVWYVDDDLSRVIHLSGSHAQLASVYTLTTPYQVASSTGGTAWASDIGTSKVHLLDTNGAILKTVTTPKPLYEMTRDYRGGFFAAAESSEGDIYHYAADGAMDMHITAQFAVSGMKGCPYGCVLYFDTSKTIKYVDLATSSILRTYSLTSNYVSYPDIFWCDLASSQTNFESQGSILIPQTADPVWSTLAWTEVPKNGYFLPKSRYHQARLTLQSNYSAINAKVNSISMQKPIKISSIQPNSGQDMYIKTTIPSDAVLDDYSAKLKTWWDIQE